MKIFRSDENIDNAVNAYQREHDRWDWRCNVNKKRGSVYELVRNSSPDNDINADEYFEITTFSKRECPDRHYADMWLNTYRGRAAMRAALEAL